MKKYIRYVLIILIAFGIGVCTNLAHPVTPYLIKAEGWPEFSFSVFFSVMSLGMLLMAPFWGTMGDRHGRAIVLLICSFGYSLGQVLFGIFENIVLVVLARFFSGCFSAGLMVSVISYCSSSITLKEFDRKRLIPTVMSFSLVGTAIGSFLGGKMGVWLGGDLRAYRSVLFIQASILSCFGIFIFFSLGRQDEEIHENAKRSNFIHNIINVKKIGLWSILFLISLTLFSIVFTNVQRFLDYYYSDLGKTSGELGSLNLVIGFVTLFANTLITPILLKKLNPIYSILLSAVLGAISILVTFLAPSTYLSTYIYSVWMVYIVSKAVIESASVEYISKNACGVGLIMGVRQSFISLGAVIGPLAGGAIYYSYDIPNRKNLFIICAAIYLFAAGIVAIIYVFRHKFKSNLEGGIECESEV